MSSFPSNQSLHDQASAWSCLSGFPDDQGFQQRSTRLQLRDETEELLMSEFNKLSTDEQVKALDDIYSAGSELKENPAMIDRLLTEFEQLVEHGNYPIYETALNQDRSYVEDPSFRLSFLRANLHDVSKAVDQMIRFLYKKAKYFGTDKLTQDITLDDLTSSDLKLMLSGICHIQDGTDRTGRPIMYILSTLPPNDVNSQIRVFYYICVNILIPVHSVQMKGVVMVLYNLTKPGHGHTAPPGLGEMKQLADFATSIPLRKTAFHFCTKRVEGGGAPLRDAFVQYGFNAMPKFMRERARVHRGSPMELEYKLSTFGIPRDTFPIDMHGNLNEGIKNIWFYKHLEREGGIIYDDNDSAGESSTSSRMEVDDGNDQMSANESDDEGDETVPYSNRDVLLGRGYTVQNHPGNVAFREFLRGSEQEYDRAPRLSRRQIAVNLTRILMSTGIRFWQKAPDGDAWIESSFDEAVKKVGQIFRSARKKR